MAWGAVAGAAIGAGASIAGQYFANRASRRSVNRQLAWQREATINRYQWQMDDMRKAGLNPILSYRQAPPGATAGASYTARSLTEGVPQSVNSAVNAYKASAENRRTEAEIKNVQEDTKYKTEQAKTERVKQTNTWSDTQLKNAQGVLTSTQVEQSRSAAALSQSQTAVNKLRALIAEERAKMARAGAAGAKHEEELMNTAYGKWLKWLDVTGRSLNPFASSAKTVKGLSD